MARNARTTPLPDGLYDQLLTESLWTLLQRDDLRQAHSLRAVPPDEAAQRLSEHLVAQMAELLDTHVADPSAQLHFINHALTSLRRKLEADQDAADPVYTPLQSLHSVHRHRPAAEPPETGLSLPWLFTAGKGSPSLLTELRKELAACDHADILVSFITYSGVRKLLDILKAATAIDATGQPRTCLRILTTTYTGATEISALDALAELPGCEVRISLDGRRTRLHAKAWMFQRRSGFGTAYVGSANLSGAALAGGLEWTLKFTQHSQADLFERARAHFETLWEDSEFQRYEPQNEQHRTALRRALKNESGSGEPARPTWFELQPKSYQQDMLDQLQHERHQGRRRNLVVAATGTGKTVVAAFDYRNICTEMGGRPRLLFVAHREEILWQALSTWRQVLRDNEFGELLTGRHTPQHYDHVFATIQSALARDLVDRMGASHWHMVIVDECHHMAAAGFHRFVSGVRPRLLLGLTATPERGDGQPILDYFDNRPDGSPAVELRLWHALDLQLLCPFEYYACDDDTDFSEVPWDRAGERTTLEKLVTGNDVRAHLIIREWRRLSGQPTQGKALVFCVSAAHAEFMAKKFNEAGIPAQCLLGETPREIRERAPGRLARGELAAIVTCDLYNEGVDLPYVDTLLLLRPTQSPVLFQQQIGRGLRLAPGKQSCLVLDFVGRHRQEFRFDRLFGTLTGLSRRELISAVEHDFSGLPPGCHIQLQRQTRDQVLASVRRLAQQNWRRMRTEIQAYASLEGRTVLELNDFLRDQVIALEDIYRPSGHSGWTRLRHDAGLLLTAPSDDALYFSRRFTSLLHIDDHKRLDLLQRISTPGRHTRGLTLQDELLLQMLAYQIDGQHHQTGSGIQFLQRLRAEPVALDELRQLVVVLDTRNPRDSHAIPGLEDTPLGLHASYHIREILSAVGWLTADRRTPFQAGVLPLESRCMELLFVTLDKREGYHERIAYHDYAISPERFHWQSQNSAGPHTRSGRRYLESPENGWQFQLFVRTAPAEPYQACGPVILEDTEGSGPMSIHWRLERPLPPRLFQAYSVLRDG